MPSKESVESYQRYMSTGICDCGQPTDKHAETIEAMKSSPINCSILKDELIGWHTPRAGVAA